MVTVGYARISNWKRAGLAEASQRLEAQRTELAAAGCTRIFADQIASTGECVELELALQYVREGDSAGSPVWRAACRSSLKSAPPSNKSTWR
jgi:DNA invertase Pin-like site-specific DNA recombinase